MAWLFELQINRYFTAPSVSIQEVIFHHRCNQLQAPEGDFRARSSISEDNDQRLLVAY